MKRTLLGLIAAGLVGTSGLAIQRTLSAEEPIYQYSLSPKGELCEGSCKVGSCCKITLVPPIKP